MKQQLFWHLYDTGSLNGALQAYWHMKTNDVTDKHPLAQHSSIKKKKNRNTIREVEIQTTSCYGRSFIQVSLRPRTRRLNDICACHSWQLLNKLTEFGDTCYEEHVQATPSFTCLSLGANSCSARKEILHFQWNWKVDLASSQQAKREPSPELLRLPNAVPTLSIHCFAFYFNIIRSTYAFRVLRMYVGW